MQLYQDTIQDRNGNVISSAVVTITDYPGGSASNVYATDAVGTNINPITADSDGQYEFYAVPGAYTLTVTKSGVTTESKVVTLGAAATSFLQSGTGAVSRSVQAKERDIVSVKDFGAVGDGTTDDTAALTAAAALGKALKLPEGTYKTTSAIACVAGTSWEGDGPGNSIILSSHNGRCLDYTNVDTYGVFIKNLAMQGPGSNGTGLWVSSTTEVTAHLHMENVRVYNFAKGTDGTSTYAIFDSYLEKTDFLSCSTWGFRLTGSQNTLISPTFRLCGVGISVDDSSGFSIGGATVVGPTFIGNTYDVDIANATVRPLRFYGGWFEQTVTSSVKNSVGAETWFQGLTFSDCLFQPAATATGNGVIATFDYKGSVTFDGCVVYTDLYAAATLPNLSAVTGDTNVVFRRQNSYTVNGAATVTTLPDVISNVDVLMSGNLGMGDTTDATRFIDVQKAGGSAAEVHLEGEGTTRYRLTYRAASAASMNYIGIRSRGTIASPATVNNGDFGLGIESYYFDGTANRLAASIYSSVNAAVSTGIVPTKWSFQTANTSGVLTEVFSVANGNAIGFYGATPAVKPTVTGSRGGNAALADLLTELATLGLITDSSTA